MACLLKKESGTSLVELLIVMAILVLLAMAAVGALNPKKLSDQGFDARMKKDLQRIKVAFEEYYNDNGCYPTNDQISDWRLEDKSSCGTAISAFPQLRPWVCSPRGDPYQIATEDTDDDCPSWFKVYANLGNRHDGDIPEGWYDSAHSFILSGGFSGEDYNYGVSSTNVRWYERVLPDECLGSVNCAYRAMDGNCNDASDGCPNAFGSECFVDSNCSANCAVKSCVGSTYEL